MRAAADGCAAADRDARDVGGESPRGATSGEPAIEMEVAGKARMRMPGSVPAALAAAVIEALPRR